MTLTIVALVVSGVYIVSIKTAYRCGKATGFGEGIQCMEEMECGHLVGEERDQQRGS
ncbi:hypothetical protein [Chromohalobacter sp. 296-RDG]|uniref:hypothetical protein n=1 Tax=Chromohalobacter sp. 296-RDG TaxID=2994062 RepID=UPI002469AF93|nr:hypothetical protein [Chromohalobacter sp. 296-RDG]